MDKKITFITIGIVFWAVASTVMHFIGPYVFDGGLLHIAFWVANFFFPAIALPLVAKMTSKTKHDMLIPTVLMVIPSMTLDGFSLTFDTLGRTHIYAKTPHLAGLTGGFLLFALMSFLVWALIWHKSDGGNHLI